MRRESRLEDLTWTERQLIEDIARIAAMVETSDIIAVVAALRQLGILQ